MPNSGLPFSSPDITPVAEHRAPKRPPLQQYHESRKEHVDRPLALVNATGRLKPTSAGGDMSRWGSGALGGGGRVGTAAAVLAGRIATDIAGYRTRGARHHYRLIGGQSVVWRLYDQADSIRSKLATNRS